MAKSKKIWGITSIVLILIVALSGLGYWTYTKYNDMEEQVNRAVIYEGIRIQGIDVGNKTKQEAYDLLSKYIQENEDAKQLVVYYGDLNWILTYEDWGLEANVEEMVNKAYALGKDGTVFERYKFIKSLKESGAHYDLSFDYNRDIITSVLEDINSQLNKDVKDATITRISNAFQISEEEIALLVDVKASRKKIIESLMNHDEGKVQLVVEEMLPTMTKQYLGHVKDVVGGFYTKVSRGNPQRDENLRVAASKLDGLLLMPGEVLSTMESIGPVDLAHGYKEAPIILKGKIVPGVGGGICQVATTLYNAVLQAELEVVERRNHSMPISYVPLGKDAVVSGSVLDFKFKNNTEYPIYIESYMKDHRLYVNLYGEETRDMNRFVQYEPIVIEKLAPPEEVIELDETLEPGSEEIVVEAKDGYRVKLLKHIFVDDKRVSTEVVNYSYYKPRAREKKIGPALPEVAETVQQPEGNVTTPTIVEDVYAP